MERERKSERDKERGGGNERERSKKRMIEREGQGWKKRRGENGLTGREMRDIRNK